MATSNYNYSIEQNAKYNEKTSELLEMLPQYCTSFINSIYENTMPRSRLGYLQDVRVFFLFLKEKNPLVKDIPLKEIPVEILDQLDQEDILEFLRYLEGYSIDGKQYSNGPAGKKRKLASIRALYKFLTTTKGYINNNPAIKVVTPTVKEKQIRTLDNDERKALFKVIEDEIKTAEKKYGQTSKEEMNMKTRQAPAIAKRNKAIIYLFLGSGMRISELVGIDLENINFPNSRINILRKGGGDDHVYLSDTVMDALLDYINTARDTLLPAFEIETALFLSSKHTRITPRSIERMISDYAKKALGANSGITPHKFRSTFGTQYYTETNDIFATASVLGHASIETTKRHYVKPGEAAKQNMRNIDILGGNE